VTIASYRADRLREVVLAKQCHRRTQLLDAGRHFVADAHDVADLQPRRDLDVDAAHHARRLVIQVARLEVAVLDDVISLAIVAAAGSRHRVDRVLAVLDGGHGHHELIPGPLARARQRERNRGRLGCPSRRQLQRELAFACRRSVVGQFHL
jgi:hypothetical protein